MKSDKKQLQKELDTFLGKGKTWRKRIFFTIVIVGLLLLVDIYGPGGQVRFYAKWVECGRRPVEARGSGFMNVGAAHYVNSSAVSLVHVSSEYYCTPLEAERAGLSAKPDRYEYPHLEAAGEHVDRE